MTLLAILKYPHPLLRRKAIKIKNPLEPQIQALIPRMIEAMKKGNGLGLAAPQVGKSLRLCIVGEEKKVYVLINPSIKSCSRKKVFMEEGCLSFPGKFFLISRPEAVKVRYLDETGKKAKIKAQGLLARTLQHEIDHLDGILVIDRAKKKKAISYQKVKK
ncbi:MAG: peptide deformylase [Candidatus Moranbacteria bacterium]|nr:peptide deformylase [Candidatus Moranbacteria bacterium]